MKNNDAVLVTGGAGYIGSHTCVELLEAGFSVIVADNLCNSRRGALDRVQQITGKPLVFVNLDLRDQPALADLFAQHRIGTVMHFAGLKAVGESCQKPLEYYHNNVYGTLTLLAAMQEAGVRRIIFSSSATVYGASATPPYTEDTPISAINPYGSTKVVIEGILRDLVHATASVATLKPWKIALLRYFNPIGAHPSGLIGEDPNGIPNNLLPYLSQVAVGKLAQLSVFGNDYPTQDGTGVRDYIHVVDLAQGHVKALDALESPLFEGGGCRAYNLGTGTGYSVLEVIEAFEKASGQRIAYNIAPRRAGDLAECYANPERAYRELNWKAVKTLPDMVADAWHWQRKNPHGYASE